MTDKSYENITEYLIEELREWVEGCNDYIAQQESAIGIDIDELAWDYWDRNASVFTREIYEVTKSGSMKSTLEAIKEQRLLIQGWSQILLELHKTYLYLNDTTDDYPSPY